MRSTSQESQVDSFLKIVRNYSEQRAKEQENVGLSKNIFKTPDF